jgi:ABC-type glycerol-3-phosphate transport system substrate-binding protein
MGAMVETDEESLEVWLATGRDQAQVKRNLVNNEFTPETGIAVELKLVAGGTLLPSILAKQGPDVYHGLGQGDVINYAIRGAILPVYSENPIYYDGNESEGNPEIRVSREDFLETTNSFNESAMIVLGMEDADGDMNYYGLPEAQGFAMMFVRIDILAELGLDVPKTWGDILAADTYLQARNMEMGVPVDTNIHLYQMGGELFADEGMRINLGSDIGLKAFNEMCLYFTDRGFPYTYDAANRFRTGEMPILIGDYTGLYNQLKVFATEIDGLWTMVPVPGYYVLDEEGNKTYDEDGNAIINNSAVSSVNASVMIKGVEADKTKDAWEYIKWFTGAECQESYGNEMVAIMGPSAKYNTANKQALNNVPWTAEERIMIEAQFSNLASIPNYPGSYIIARYTDFAFMAAYNDNMDPQEAIKDYIPNINEEITRKRAEFGLETLATGQTLAGKRLGQASAGVKEYDSRVGDKALLAEIELAIESDDIVMLRGAAERVKGLVSAEDWARCTNSVKIAKGPDITDKEKIGNAELLYYISVALSEAADALSSY